MNTQAAQRRHRVLVIEDDAAIMRGLRDALERAGYEVLTAATGHDGLRSITGRKLDLVLLDAMLPGMNGFDVCKAAREAGKTMPIIMLTARSMESDRVMGLDMGADDYVTKPFSLPELLARVRATLRRYRPDQVLPDKLEMDDVTIDFQRYQATRAGERIPLTSKEFGVLRLLAARAGEAVTRAELLDEVWGYETETTTRTVDNHIASLRSKLGDNGSNSRLVTVHGVGYKLDFANP